MTAAPAPTIADWTPNFRRSLIAAGGISILGFGLAYPIIEPTRVDPTLHRLIIAGACAAAIGASLRWPAFEQRLDQLVAAVGWGITLWVLWLTGHNGFAPSYEVGFILTYACVLVVFRSARALVGYAVAMLAATGACFAADVPPEQVILVLVSELTMGPIIGLTVQHRERLSGELERSRNELEARVRERTVALEIQSQQLAAEAVERRAAEQQALGASRAKSAFLAAMSHELRTPLNAILGYSELICEEITDLDAGAVVADAGRIDSAARHLLGLVDQVLDLARIEAGKVDLAFRPVSLRTMLAEVEDTVRPLVTRHANALVLETGPSAAAVVTDPERLRQILINLVANAAKFTDHGTIRVGTTRDPDGSLRIAVADTGCGIEPAALPRLFQRFAERAHPERGGTGLGLAISRELAQLLGGRLEVESELGVGSTFTVVLPG